MEATPPALTKRSTRKTAPSELHAIFKMPTPRRLTILSRLEHIESEIQQMSPEEIAAFRAWFAEFDAAAWDRQFEEDAKAGKLDVLVSQALRDHEAGHSTKL